MQAIRSITAARKQKKAIELQGMRANADLSGASKALQKVVDNRGHARSDLLQLQEQLQLEEQDDQPIIELVVSDFGGPPPHKRLHRTDGKKKHHHHHHREHDGGEDEEQARKAKQEKDQSDQDVESKEFDAEDLEAYTANAGSSNSGEARRKGAVAQRTGDEKRAVDLAASLGATSKTPAEKVSQSLSETQKTSMEEDSVSKASSEPTVQQVDAPVEPTVSSSPATGQKLSQDTERSDRAPKEAQESTEAPKSQPVEQKKVDGAPATASKPQKQAAQYEKEDTAAERYASSGKSSEDDITAYSQYLDSNLGQSSLSEKDPTPASPLAGQATEMSSEQPGQQAPP